MSGVSTNKTNYYILCTWFKSKKKYVNKKVGNNNKKKNTFLLIEFYVLHILKKQMTLII